MNNINEELEKSIENKYVKYKENVKFTIEEAIYILKRKDFCDEVENIAIENLIQENKELKTKLQEHICIEAHEQVKQLYIPKSKVKEKIEELEKLQNNNRKDLQQALNFLNFKQIDEISDKIIINMTVRDILKQLLEEGE